VYTTPIDTITNPRYAAASNLIITYTKITGLSEGIKYMCIDASDNLYMGSTGSSVYKYSGGTVTTFTGFNRPTGLVLDNNNYLYVADTSNNVLKVISPVGTISTVLGSGTAGFTDSSGSDVVTFTAPTCVVIDSASNIYVGEGRAGIRKITVQYTPNLSKFNLPFIGPYTTTSQVTFGSNITSKVGLQVVNNSFVGASYAEVLDLTS
jgi:sugar lactone lactonase YvrE